jgi:hypothetical protein
VPQFNRSDWRSLQNLWTRPAPGLVQTVPGQAHVPPEHISKTPAVDVSEMYGQPWPHPPQLLTSVFVFVHEPEHSEPPTPGQTHCPDTHDALAGHAVMQLPHVVLLVVRLLSQPLDATPSQSSYPGAHVATVQVPDAQPASTTSGSAQTIPHALQFFGSLARLTQVVGLPQGV